MKNHWIKKHQEKGFKWWNIEFLANGLYLLKPRRVELVDKSCLEYLSGTMALVFFNVSKDKDLSCFISNCQQGMVAYARLRHYEGVFPIAIELENYELTCLAYRSIFMGPDPDTIKFTFDFGFLRKYTMA